jgi:hypothetical protein
MFESDNIERSYSLPHLFKICLLDIALRARVLEILLHISSIDINFLKVLNYDSNNHITKKFANLEPAINHFKSGVANG